MRVPKCRRSRGGCVDLVLQIWIKCRQGEGEWIKNPKKLCRHHLSTAQDGTAPNGNPIHVTNLKGTTAPNAGLYNSSLVQAFYGEHAGAGGERLLARVHVRADAGGEGPRPRHVVRRQVGGRPLLLQEGKGG